LKFKVESAKNESTKVKEVNFIRQMNSLNQGLIIDKKYDDAAHRREQEKQKRIEKVSKFIPNFMTFQDLQG
jgi:hypothetical protein